MHTTLFALPLPYTTHAHTRKILFIVSWKHTPSDQHQTLEINTQYAHYFVILNNPRLKNMDQNSLCSPLKSMDKYHPMFTKVET